MTFGQRLKMLRDEKDLTQQDIADILKVTRPTIAGYETKGKQPDYDKLIALAEYFNVSIDFLMGVSDIRNPYIEPDLEKEYEEVFDYLDEFVQEMKARGYDYSDKSREELAELFVKLLKATDIIKDTNK